MERAGQAMDKFADLFRRLPTYWIRSSGARSPATVPVEQPTKFELVINLKTAKALGLRSRSRF